MVTEPLPKVNVIGIAAARFIADYAEHNKTPDTVLDEVAAVECLSVTVLLENRLNLFLPATPFH